MKICNYFRRHIESHGTSLKGNFFKGSLKRIIKSFTKSFGADETQQGIWISLSFVLIMSFSFYLLYIKKRLFDLIWQNKMWKMKSDLNVIKKQNKIEKMQFRHVAPNSIYLFVNTYRYMHRIYKQRYYAIFLRQTLIFLRNWYRVCAFFKLHRYFVHLYFVSRDSLRDKSHVPDDQ